ncbi:energy transducer TonB [Nitrospirillum sp. BR 11164]|uniref:energy transducer TonB n=1 Tax=Nitrospirillum sp. BR 11164 TaxID=3104324 RepID=UPI002AFDF4A6|nr:energy transducer TonB [Nitrospirillum sp. BR 11164]MEA1649335.1 energy transducer TonB [Nitrospirillum sp. BR 11164]
MRTSAAHAILSGVLVVLACWPFAPPTPSATAAEKLSLPITMLPPIGAPVVLEGDNPDTGSPLETSSPSKAGPVTAKIDLASLRKFRPAFPVESGQMNGQGRVVFLARCGTDYLVSDAVILESSGYEPLDRAVLDTARSHRWRCKPLSAKGRAHDTWAKAAYRVLPGDLPPNQLDADGNLYPPPPFNY